MHIGTLVYSGGGGGGIYGKILAAWDGYHGRKALQWRSVGKGEREGQGLKKVWEQKTGNV